MSILSYFLCFHFSLHLSNYYFLNQIHNIFLMDLIPKIFFLNQLNHHNYHKFTIIFHLLMLSFNFAFFDIYFLQLNSCCLNFITLFLVFTFPFLFLIKVLLRFILIFLFLQIFHVFILIIFFYLNKICLNHLFQWV